jgi:hypothetical protein
MAGQYSKDATALVSIIKAMEAGTEKTQLIQAYADSLKTIWIVMCALSGVAMVASIFIQGYSLDQEHKTLQGFHEDRVKDPENDASSGSGLEEMDKAGTSQRH